MLVADVDGSGVDDVVVDFGASFGVWGLLDLTTWLSVHGASPESMVAGDVDGNGIDDLTFDLGAAHGLWTLRNLVSWHWVHAVSPEAVM